MDAQVLERPKLEAGRQDYISKLQLATWKLMQGNPESPMEIAVKANVSYPWLIRFRSERGLYDHCTAIRLEKLYQYLTGKTLTF